MPLFNRVAIIGVGLIGGSLAKALKNRRLCKKVIGYFRNKTKLSKALKTKIVDEGYLKLDRAVLNSDLVVLAMPINQIINFMHKIKSIRKNKLLIIDVGSTKSQVMATAHKLKLDFVGTHPLAGSEKRGADSSSGKLFVGSKVIITPTKNTQKKSLTKITRFWNKLGAQTLILSPKQHDKILAFTSHLPHLSAFCLINSIPDTYLKFSATGLKDSTRIALSDADIWSDILLSNKKSLLSSIKSFESRISKMKKAIQKNKRGELLHFINSSKERREKIE